MSVSFDDFSISLDKKAALVSIVTSTFENHQTLEQTETSLNELEELLRTLGVEAGSRYIQKKDQLDPATMLGKGKLQEIAEQAKAEGSEILVFDFELTASQTRNIKKYTGMDAIDRCTIILEIFAKHARTNEAKIQIEISRLRYLLPRLSSLWTHFTKQKGGIGLKGEGEQQLELDRRIIRQKIEAHKRELLKIEGARKERSKKRAKNVVTAALVGYTNAGKSSIMNRLCQVDVLEENKLFATLDSTYRTLNPDSKPPMVLIDTVGFISNLPNTLIEGFKTTLESALEADLLILVCDLADPNYQNQIKVTQDVLKELNIVDKDQIIVFNKKDKLENPFLPKLAAKQFKDSFLVSSYDPEDMKNLRKYIIDYFLDKQSHYDLFIPYDLGELHAKIQANANIVNTGHLNDGIFYRIKIPEFLFNQLGVTNYILAPESQIYQKLDQ